MKSTKVMQTPRFDTMILGSRWPGACLALALWVFPTAANAGDVCCHDCTGACTNVSSNVICQEPTTRHLNTTCGTNRACMLNGGAGPCLQIAAICCADFGGISLGKNSVCEDLNAGACCIDHPAGSNDGVCQLFDEYQCITAGGAFHGTGTYCNCAVQACCNGNSCQDQDTACCLAEGGTPGGFGSNCDQACCTSAGGTCVNMSASCCAQNNGVPAGAGPCGPNPEADICDFSKACCKPDGTDGGEDVPWCLDQTPFQCAGNDGTSDLSGTCAALEKTESDDDDIPNSCDNCPGVDNESQADTEQGGLGDGVGNACDNCPNHVNPQQENPDGDGYGSACDNCPLVSNDQFDCDGDGLGDLCDSEPNRDYDSRADDCDNDDDNDDVLDADDVCDYTPLGVPVEGVNVPNHRLRGTIYGDVDGDCDRDQTDLNLMQATPGTLGQEGADYFEELCPP